MKATQSSMSTNYGELAKRLRDAAINSIPCEPIRHEVTANDVDAAYEIQRVNTAHWLAEGREIVGRKIGLTAKSVQEQLGVNEPDFGVLFSDMVLGDGECVSMKKFIQPRVEAEIAFVMGADVLSQAPTVLDIIKATEYVLPAIEIVDSRVENWDINILDTIADNASSGMFVLGGPIQRLEGVSLRGAMMLMERNGSQVSAGSGAACLGNPINAVSWLARKLASMGDPLRAGDVVLSGALGVLADVQSGDRVEVRISGVGEVRIDFAD